MLFNSRVLPLVCVLFFANLLVSANAKAALIYESATLGQSVGGGTGTPVTGSWFSLTETTQITALGGHFSVSGPAVWASIIELPNGVLPENDFDIEVNSLVSGLIPTLNGPSLDRRVAVDALLAPGDYAILIGGGGLFGIGANSLAIMPKNGTDFPGAQYFSQYFPAGSAQPVWDDGTVLDRSGTRLVVEGVTAVPEPSSMAMFALAGVGFFAAQRRRRKGPVHQTR